MQEMVAGSAMGAHNDREGTQVVEKRRRREEDSAIKRRRNLFVLGNLHIPELLLCRVLVYL